MTTDHCPRSIPARIVYRMLRYSIRLSFALNLSANKALGPKLGPFSFGLNSQAEAEDTEINSLPDAVLVRVFSISCHCAHFEELRQEIAMTTKVRRQPTRGRTS
jgi:hypothetical protein